MGNIQNYNVAQLKLQVSNSDYWDFFLANDYTGLPPSGVTSGTCLVTWYDFNNPLIYATGSTSADTIYSLVSWNGALNSGYTIDTIGLTGIDNGLVTFDKTSGDTSNQALLSALTGTTLIIPSGDTRLTLHRVTGTTETFIYPIDIVTTTATTGNYASLCGGFYQGFYKLDGYSYQVLPVRENYAWAAEFWLNKDNISCTGYTGTTLNDTYPNNKGFFFYMGTRAENKFWNTFYGADTGCTSGCTQPSGCTDSVSEWCTIPKETDIILSGDYNIGIPLNPPLVEVELITNGFLIYGRASLSGASGCTTCSGPGDGLGNQTVCSYDGNGIVVSRFGEVITNTNNPFLVYGRGSLSGGSGCHTCTGPNDGFGNQTVCTFSGFTSPQTTLDYKIDVIDNALGFRIKDDGSIGYRLLTVTGTCVEHGISGSTYITGVTVQEEYSLSGMVSGDVWTNIVIRWVSNEYLDDCQLLTASARTGTLMFYINGYLKFVVHNFSEFIARRLNENKLKQVGVPFNFSLGGGSQGLKESQTFDGLDPEDRGLPIETNFAGTFIGSISQFKFNICDLNFIDIQNNYNNELSRYL